MDVIWISATSEGHCKALHVSQSPEYTAVEGCSMWIIDFDANDHKARLFTSFFTSFLSFTQGSL